jgi:hypothetical protein
MKSKFDQQFITVITPLEYYIYAKRNKGSSDFTDRCIICFSECYVWQEENESKESISIIELDMIKVLKIQKKFRIG